ncbi:hypothetical protein GALL_304480 [mine drainage metagenome]|uniref:Uncharacterized protein n=1 Tax=mine drainage metagenome TaxID=410659 RepID=A0A1J5RDF5_9ZZZZ
MSTDDEDIIRRTFAEASLAAREKGLSGLRAHRAVLNTAVVVSTRILHRAVTAEEVERVMGHV